MTSFQTLLASLSLAIVPVAAAADGVSLSFGATLTSNYIFNSVTQTKNGAALQPYVELDTGSFYTGLWFSNVAFGANKLETDVYAGLRGDFGGSGGLSYDLAYYRYYYDKKGDLGGELIVSLGYAVSDSTSFGTILKNDLIGGPLTVVLNGSHDFASGYGLTGRIGKPLTPGGSTYWDIGIGKSITDSVSVDLRYYDSDATTPIYGVSLTWGADWNSAAE